MINELTMTCFRKVEQDTMVFTEGLNVIRGPNEGSKTTRMEACAYALFGTKALRNSLAETVTWGRKEAELKADLKITVNRVSYRFTRSKAGAEVYVDGDSKPFVTGQTEVSNFAADLLGTDVNAASHLMLSGQGNLRGVLEQGPKATSTLIENLSNLELIEEIIEKAQEKLQLGSTAVLEDRLKSAEETLKGTTVPTAPEPVDQEKTAASLAQAAARVQVAIQKRDQAKAAYDVEAAKLDKVTSLNSNCNLIDNQITEATTKRDAALASIKPTPSIKPIEQALQNALDWDNQRKAYAHFQSAPKSDFSMPAAGFQTMHPRLLATLQSFKNVIATMGATINALKPQIATTHTCPACGQDTAHLEEVKQRQAKLQDDLNAAIKALANAEAGLPEAQENVEEAQQLIVINEAVLKAGQAAGKYVEVSTATMPATLTWLGTCTDFETGPDVSAYQRQLDEAMAIVKANTAAEALVVALNDLIAGLNEKRAEVLAQIGSLAVLTADAYAELVDAYDTAVAILNQEEGIQAMLKIEQDVALSQYQAAKLAYDQALGLVQGLDEQVKQLKADIASTQFNNSLLKKLRAARPIIANKLWSLVLSTVSTLFSQMRGDQSIVTKGKDGFLVNGKPVESLSGSTLDILGLAIRCALIKTFIPNCPFIVLDEPSAACDAERSAALIGFIAASGFQQTIMVTHEDSSESLAANLIQL